MRTPYSSKVLKAALAATVVIAVAASAGGVTSHVARAASTTAIVEAWGYDYYSQLGYGVQDPPVPPCFCAEDPVAVPVLTPTAASKGQITALAAGGSHSVALVADPISGATTVWSWGLNNFGEAGNGAKGQINTIPVEVVTGASGPALTAVTAVAAGQHHSTALRSDGTVWAWGLNANGQLGNNTITDSDVAVEVRDSASTFLSGVTAIAAGGDHSLALKSDGTVWAWGYNYFGQLGNNTALTGGVSGTDSSLAVQVSSLTGVAAIAAGRDHSLAVKTDGTVWTWGGNILGSLGDNSSGTSADSAVPVQVKVNSTTNLTGVSTSAGAIAGGGDHSLAVKTDGTVWTWGDDSSGQLGDGATSSFCNGTQSPVAIQATTAGGISLTGITAVAAGAHHSLALGTGGSVWSWGSNAVGQLGDGVLGDPTGMVCASGATTTNRPFALPVPLADPAAAIAQGGTASHVLVLVP